MLVQNTNTSATSNFLWPCIFLILGMLMVVYQSLGFDLSIMPGDLDDARFNNYILEHGYQYLIGKQASYWNAPFFFPEKDVISYSDNLFGALPIYVACRFFTDRETAFQLWYLILIVLNFWGAYYAIRKLNTSVYASSVGAFIYTFSALLLLQSTHIQLLPRYVAPFAIISFYLWLQGGRNLYFYLSVFLLVYQFYCAIYLGYFLMYVLMIMFGVHLVRERKADVLLQLFKTKNALIYTLIFFIVIIVLLAILFYPYYLRSIDGDGYPSMHLVRNFSPRIWSYFLTTDRSVCWGWLNTDFFSNYIPPRLIKGENHIFIGILPYVFVIATLLKYRRDLSIRFFLIVLIVIILLTLSVFEYNIYQHIVYFIPGARAIRVLKRYIVIAVFLWSVISALFLDRFLSASGKYTMLIIFILPILLVLDNIHYANPNASSKRDFQKRSMLVVEKYNQAKKLNPSAKAFALHFNTDSITDEKKQMRTAYYCHIDAMMASQIIGLPCVNGYSARNPPEYELYYLSPDENKLNAWLHSNRVKTTVKESYEVKDILILE